MIAVDTNLLVYAHRSGCPEHEASRQAIERAANLPDGWAIALPSFAEFWMVVTHPSCEEAPSDPATASQFLVDLIRTGKPRILMPGREFGERLTRTAVELGVTGVRIFNLQIALMAVDGGARELWTHDAGFIGLPGLRIEDPLS